MDHKQEHHQHHQKEREKEIKRKREHERKEEKGLRAIHPAWFLILGIVLTILVLIVWSFAPFDW